MRQPEENNTTPSALSLIKKPGGQLANTASNGTGLGGSLARSLAKTGTNSIDTTRQTNQVLSTIRTAAETKTAEQAERLGSGRIAVEIGCDFSASTETLNQTLRIIAEGIGEEIRAKNAQARVTFGIFGGGDLIQTRQSANVLNNEHVSTNCWESTFDTYSSNFAQSLDPIRQNVLITFHDARPSDTTDLDESIEVMNKKGVISIICYIPNGGPKDDARILKDLASPVIGFKRGVFIDFTGIDYTNPRILQGLITQIVDAIKTTNQEGLKEANGNSEIGAIAAHTRLLNMVGTIVQKAKTTQLPEGKPGRLLR